MNAELLKIVEQNSLIGELAARGQNCPVSKAIASLLTHETESVEQAVVWLRQFQPSTNFHKSGTYYWKHICERQLPRKYITESAFALALVLAGYQLRQMSNSSELYVQANIPEAAAKG